MDVRPPAPLAPGAAFEVEIFVDQEAARAGEDSTDIQVPAGTHVQVHLIASEHFLITGPIVQPMIIAAAPRSDAPPFHLTVKPAAELPAAGPPHITALFMHEGRPCGMVRRAVEIIGVAAQAVLPAPARFEMTPTQNADLHITVVAGEEKDGRKFTCLVQTPHLAAYREPVSEPWTLPEVAGTLVRGYMNEFTAKNATRSARIASLRGAGVKLFDASPKIFRKVFWELIDTGVPLKDIAVVSEEPFIPWELMFSNRQKPGGGPERRKPLGVEFRIGRWTTPDMVKPRQKLTLTNSYLIAPDYMDVRKKAQAREGRGCLCRQRIRWQAGRTRVFRRRRADAEGRGEHWCISSATAWIPQAGSQVIELENNEQLTSTSIEGMDGIEEAFQLKMKPIVFLNACEIGRPAPALVGLGGFAASFIRLGASAVIAPLWSVKDAIAHEIAMEFYKRVKEEAATPFAEIFRKIREKAYDVANGEDTYASYSFLR